MSSASLAVTLFLFLVTSCTKEEDIKPSLEETPTPFSLAGIDVLLKDGLIHIPDGESMLTIDKEYKYASDLRAAVDRQVSFISSGEKFEDLSEEDFPATGSGLVPDEFKSVAHLNLIQGEQYLEPISDEPALLELANSNGQFAVGDELITVRSRKLIMIPLADIKEYGMMPEQHPMARVHYPTTNRIKIQTTAPKRNIGLCVKEFGNSGKGRRRLRGEIEENTGLRGIFSNEPTLNVRARTKFFRKGSFGIWYGEKADMLRHEGSLAFQFSNIGEYIDESDTDTQEFNTLFDKTGPVERFFGGINHTAFEGSSVEDCLSIPDTF